MIILKYLFRELFHTILAMVAALLIIMLSVTLVKYLTQVAAGSMPFSSAIALIGIILPRFLNMLIPICCFLSIVLVYGKMFANSELRVMIACGLSWWRLAAYTLLPGALLTVLVAMLSLYVVPKMNYYGDNLSAIATVKANSLSLANTGQFIPFGKRVVYIGSIDHKSGDSKNIFLYQKLPQNKMRLILAPTGFVRNTKAGQSLVLKDGRVYQGKIGQRDLQLMHFNSYQAMLGKAPPAYASSDVTAVSTAQLIEHPNHYRKVALQWRLMFPFSVIILTLLGVALCYIGPRKGRYSKLLSAFLVFIIYFNMMTILKSWLNYGIWPLSPGLWVIVIVFGGYAILRLSYLDGWLSLPKLRRKA